MGKPKRPELSADDDILDMVAEEEGGLPADVPDVKCCNECAEQLPATEDYFYSDATRPDGLMSTCISCRTKRQVERENRAIADKVDQLDRAAINVIERLANDEDLSHVPHVVEVYQRIMEAYDGVGGFAQHFMANYLSAKPGSQIRQRMLDKMINLAMKISEEGMAQKPVELMTDEDLQLELERQAKRHLRITHDDGEDQGAA